MAYEEAHAEPKQVRPRGAVEGAMTLLANHLGRLDQASTDLIGLLNPILRDAEPVPSGPSHDGRGGSALAERLFLLADEVEARAAAIERLVGRIDL